MDANTLARAFRAEAQRGLMELRARSQKQDMNPLPYGYIDPEELARKHTVFDVLSAIANVFDAVAKGDHQQ
jgi:hypothetical protein